MSREWKPGDVAMADAPNCVSFVVVRTGRDDRAHWSAPGDWPRGVSEYECEFRPLVVIDPEDERDLDRLQDALITVGRRIGQGTLSAALREFANPTPPKPDEPMGLGAVVEDARGKKWIAHEPDGLDVSDGYRWLMAGTSINRIRCQWSDIAAVRILSEGVQP